MTITKGLSGLIAFFGGAVIATFVFYLILRYSHLHSMDLLVLAGEPLAMLVRIVSPHAAGLGGGSSSLDLQHGILYRLLFSSGKGLNILFAWIQFSLYFGLIAYYWLTRWADRRQALTINETVPGAWLNSVDEKPAQEELSQPPKTKYRIFKLVGACLVTGIGVSLFYVASLFGLNGGQLASVPAVIFIWLGLFLFLAKKGWVLAVLCVASTLMLGFVVIAWVAVVTAISARYS